MHAVMHVPGRSCTARSVMHGHIARSVMHGHIARSVMHGHVKLWTWTSQIGLNEYQVPTLEFLSSGDGQLEHPMNK